MSASGAFYGRLADDPRALETRTGTAMTVGRIAVELEERRQGADEPESFTWWLNVATFGRTAEDFARCRKGQCVSVSGRLQHSSYRTRDGEDREGFSVLADSLVSAATQRPRGGGRRRDGDAGRGSSGGPRRDFDDAMPAAFG